jgi:hypothetical protein
VEEIGELKVGTLLDDMGKIAVVTRVIKSGALETESSLINWRVNYEIVYADGTVAIIGSSSLSRMLKAGIIKLL